MRASGPRLLGGPQFPGRAGADARSGFEWSGLWRGVPADEASGATADLSVTWGWYNSSVGGCTDYPADLPVEKQRHEGHWGWTARQVLLGHPRQPQRGQLSRWLHPGQGSALAPQAAPHPLRFLSEWLSDTRLHKLLEAHAAIDGSDLDCAYIRMDDDVSVENGDEFKCKDAPQIRNPHELIEPCLLREAEAHACLLRGDARDASAWVGGGACLGCEQVLHDDEREVEGAAQPQQRDGHRE